MTSVVFDDLIRSLNEAKGVSVEGVNFLRKWLKHGTSSLR